MTSYKKIIFAVLLSNLLANGNNIELTLVKNFYDNKYPKLMDYYNKGVSSENSYLLANYKYDSKNFNFHFNPLFRKNSSKILSLGFIYKFKNNYINIGRVSPYKFNRHSYTVSNNSLPYYQIEFGNLKKNQKSIFHLDYFISLGLLNDERPYLFDISYDDVRLDQYISSPLIHSKNFNFSIFDSNNNEFNFGFSHAAMFGGEILRGDNIVKPRSDFKTLLDVMILRTNTYQNYDINGEGNHVGSLDFIFKSNKNINISIQKMFDDKSGFLFKNGTDGVYIFEFINENNIVSNISFESIISKNQSGEMHPPGIDSYYWHNVYTKGWMQESFSIGNAFITPNNNRKTIYNSSIVFNNKIFFSFYRINEFEYYGNKGGPIGTININHEKIIEKKNGIIFQFSSELQNLTINHFINYERSLSEDFFGYKIKISKLFKL